VYRCVFKYKGYANYLQYQNILLTLYLCFYSRVVEAKAPRAIVIPARGSLPIKGLRLNDLSWQDFLGRVNDTK